MPLEIRLAPPDQLEAILQPISIAFGFPLPPERLARFAEIPELDLRLAALDDGAVVGGAGSFGFAMTLPGGAAVDVAGLTVVGVIPTHRRRGVLRAMMRRYLDEVRTRGQALSALYASEGAIYGRYGYGAASLNVEIEIDRNRATFPGPDGPPFQGRFVGEDEAARRFPEVYERARPLRSGFLSRSDTWWRSRRLADLEWQRAGRGPLRRVLFEQAGRAAAYAVYRYTIGFDHGSITGSLDVTEAIGDSPEATRAVWRFLFDVDAVQRIKATYLPIDHPLFFLVPEPRRLRMHVAEALWMRLVDVPAALSKRTYGEGGALVLDVTDAFCPWNEGRFRLDDGVARRTDDAADLALDVSALGSAYLGAFTFTQLADVGRVSELRPGALRRADALFRSERAPWCPENF